MAKKKKKSSKKKVEAPVERSPFWALAGAVVLILLAVLMLLGGFGTGGPLPVNLFHASYWVFGWAAWLVPVALGYWGMRKFTAEDRRIPLSSLLGLVGVLLFTSGLAYVTFAEQSTTGDWSGGYGGSVGQLVGSMFLAILSKFPTVLMPRILVRSRPRQPHSLALS
jgi:hypothetical protein